MTVTNIARQSKFDGVSFNMLEGMGTNELTVLLGK